MVEIIATIKGPSGQRLPDPGTARYQTFDRETWKKLTANKVKNGMEEPSYFQKENLVVSILHDPDSTDPVQIANTKN